MKKAFLTLSAIAATTLSGYGANLPYAPSAAGIKNSISAPNKEPALQRFTALMQKLIGNLPDDCSGPSDTVKTDVGLNTERQMFDLLSGAVLDALNKAPNGSAGETVQAALAPFQRIGTQFAVSRSADQRLRYELLPVQPLLVLKLAIWNQGTFVVYAPAPVSASLLNRWEIAQSDGTGDAAFEKLEMFPLWRGPSGNPRFLIVKHLSDCMAGMSYDYMVDGYEWNGERGVTTTILHKKSEFSEGTASPGKLQTTGKVIAIPYCWSGDLHFTSISAPICSLDTYDLSGDTVRLLGTQDDPEDLALIEKVIGSAESQNLVALAEHCKSPEVARGIMGTMPLNPLFDGYSSKQLGPGKEQVDLSGDKEDVTFVLEKQGPHWLVAHFQVDNQE